jgi:hypothetical protein
MRKLTGLALTAALTLAPASAAFADRGDREDREDRRQSSRRSSCTVDLALLTRTVTAEALCGSGRSDRDRSARPQRDGDRDGREDGRRSSRRSSCTLDLGVLTRTVTARALCGSERSDRERNTQRRRESQRREGREDSRRNRRASCTVDLRLLTRTVTATALCPDG